VCVCVFVCVDTCKTQAVNKHQTDTGSERLIQTS